MSTATRSRTPRLAATLRESESVTPLELFFDLVFVLALTQCTALMADEPTWEGLAKGLVTHRIVKITRAPKTGQRVFRTKGDANSVADPWRFTLGKEQQARVKLGVPYVGFVLAALAERNIRMLIVGLPALLIALFVMAGLWRDAGREAEARTAAAPTSA